MDNGYVDGLRQHDSRPRSPVIIPHNLSELRKKILFENTLLEERTLHEFSAGKGDGAGVDTGSAPLKPLTSPTPSPTPTPTPTPIPPPAGIPTATTNTITLQSGGAGYPIFIPDGEPFPKQNIGYFGGGGDIKLVWSGTRWEILGDNNSLVAYNTTSGQTTNYFPDQGNWFDYFNQPASLVFVGT